MIYCTRLIGVLNRTCMDKVAIAVLLAVLLFPISLGFSQLSDTEGTLGIVLTSFSPHNYKDEDGTTVVLGEIENRRNFAITGVKIWAGFYDDFSKQPIETSIGTTIIDVIPPFGTSPYMIKSKNPNSAITGASVNILGFNSAPLKQKLLNLESGVVDVREQLSLSGTITNNAPFGTNNTKIHLISYDAFIPPRVLGISTIEIDEIDASAQKSFEFITKQDFRASSFKIVAESRNYQSDFIEISAPTIAAINKLVTINDISLNDLEGNRLSDVSLDSPINIKSSIWLQYASDPETVVQPYVYYVQIKKSVEINDETKSFVEFIGKSEGAFQTGGTQIPMVEWTPENKGLYFAETYVWDLTAAPLASKGPITLILVT